MEAGAREAVRAFMFRVRQRSLLQARALLTQKVEMQVMLETAEMVETPRQKHIIQAKEFVLDIRVAKVEKAGTAEEERV